MNKWTVGLIAYMAIAFAFAFFTYIVTGLTYPFEPSFAFAAKWGILWPVAIFKLIFFGEV